MVVVVGTAGSAHLLCLPGWDFLRRVPFPIMQKGNEITLSLF
jgi:hypothetical protein